MVLHNTVNGLLFVSPYLLGLMVFTLYPIFASFFYSFTSYSVLEPPRFVGLENYIDIFTNDPLFKISIGNTFYYALIAIPLNLTIAMLLALVLNLQVKGMSFYRAIFFLPSIMPEVASAMLWGWILNPQIGLVNGTMHALHLPTIGWYADPLWSKPSLILISLWGLGGTMVIFLAAVQDVPKHLYEAAELDGAGAIQKTRYVTIPMLTPTILFNLILGIIGSFQYFTTSFVLTAGGPADSTLFYALLIYRNAFTYFKMGYASAMSWMLFAIVFLLTLVIFRTSNRWVYYAGENQ
jgi:multiple sugar transport system permease protein